MGLKHACIYLSLSSPQLPVGRQPNVINQVSYYQENEDNIVTLQLVSIANGEESLPLHVINLQNAASSSV